MGIRLAVRVTTDSSRHNEIVYEFNQDRIIIGRGAGADVCLPHQLVSIRHALLRASGSQCSVEDLGSTNGTFVNDTLIVAERQKAIRNGDTIRIGSFELFFQSPIVVSSPTSIERTASLARKLVRHAFGETSSIEWEPKIVIEKGAFAGTVLEFLDVGSRYVVGKNEGLISDSADRTVLAERVELIRDQDGVLAREASDAVFYINQKPVRQRRLHHGDVIEIGSTLLRFEDASEQMVSDIERKPDIEQTTIDPMHITAPALEVEPANVSATAAKVERQPRPSQEPDWESGPDTVIYVLAGLVFVLSVVGLVLLMNSG